MSRDRIRLLHIRDAIARIRSFVTTKEAFVSDARTQDAVIRNLEVIGEAVKSLARETRERRPEIPWSTIGNYTQERASLLPDDPLEALTTEIERIQSQARQDR